MKVVYEAIRMIHAHGHVPFHKRIFEALHLVFPNSRYALELFGQDGAYSMETTLPFEESGRGDILPRTAELVKAQSPMFQRLASGETAPMRLSDFISLRQLRRTDLYQEIFREIQIRHQIGIPIQSSAVLGGLTVNRDRGDYSTDDLTVAAILAPQVATAFEVDFMISRLAPAVQRAQSVDLTRLRRLGLSRREAEVMVWLVEAKRDNEIAVILGISVRTVEQHVRAILQKFAVENRTAAVTCVLQRGALPPVPVRLN